MVLKIEVLSEGSFITNSLTVFATDSLSEPCRICRSNVTYKGSVHPRQTVVNSKQTCKDDTPRCNLLDDTLKTRHHLVVELETGSLFLPGIIVCQTPCHIHCQTGKDQVLRMGSAFSRARCHMSLTASGICSSLRNTGYKELPSSQHHKPQLGMTLNLNHYNYLGNVSDVAWITTPSKRQETLPGSNAPFHWMPMPAGWIGNHPNRRWNLPANLYNQHFHKLPETNRSPVSRSL